MYIPLSDPLQEEESYEKQRVKMRNRTDTCHPHTRTCHPHTRTCHPHTRTCHPHTRRRNGFVEMSNIIRLFLCFGFAFFMFIVTIGIFAIYRSNGTTQAKLGPKAAGRPIPRVTRRITTVDMDSPVSPANEGKTIEITGTPSTTTTTLTDPEFAVTITKALRLKRVVEMRQWTEKIVQERHTGYKRTGFVNVGKYKAKWASYAISSDNFLNKTVKNPRKWPYENKVWNGENLKIGNYTIIESQAKKLDSWKELSVDEIKNLPKGSYTKDNFLYLKRPAVKPGGVGAVRIKFFKVVAEPLIIRGTQISDRLKILRVTRAGSPERTVAVEAKKLDKKN